MPCLLKYKWVKIPRETIPDSRGILTDYLRLYASAAISRGIIRYCQYENEVEEGEWAGGVVGLKSILDTRSKSDALARLERMSANELVEYEYVPGKSKLLKYSIRTDTRVKNRTKDLPIKCNNKSGFIRVPRNLTDQFVRSGYRFEEGDAWLDLWSHTVCGDNINIFSFMSPCVQFSRKSAALTLEAVGTRWGWDKYKVHHFFRKYSDVFRLVKLPGSYGCVIFNLAYPDIRTIDVPTAERVSSVCRFIKRKNRNKRTIMTDREQFCILVLKYSRKCVAFFCSENRVEFPFINAYISSMREYQSNSLTQIDTE